MCETALEFTAKATMPKDHVWLGRGGEFETTCDVFFVGYFFVEGYWLHGNRCDGNHSNAFYCAHKDSEIAKLNKKDNNMTKEEMMTKLMKLQEQVDELIDSLAEKEEERKLQVGEVYRGYYTNNHYIVLDPNGSIFCVEDNEVSADLLFSNVKYVGKFGEVFHTTEEVSQATATVGLRTYDAKEILRLLNNKNKKD